MISIVDGRDGTPAELEGRIGGDALMFACVVAPCGFNGDGLESAFVSFLLRDETA